MCLHSKTQFRQMETFDAEDLVSEQFHESLALCSHFTCSLGQVWIRFYDMSTAQCQQCWCSTVICRPRCPKWHLDTFLQFCELEKIKQDTDLQKTSLCLLTGVVFVENRRTCDINTYEYSNIIHNYVMVINNCNLLIVTLLVRKNKEAFRKRIYCK